MKAKKGSRKIIFDCVEYRWRVTGDSGFVRLTIWPLKHSGATICGTLKYDVTVTDGDSYFGLWASSRHEILITNRFVRRVLEYAFSRCNYSYTRRAPELLLGPLDDKLDLSDAIRQNEALADRRDILLGRSAQSSTNRAVN